MSIWNLTTFKWGFYKWLKMNYFFIESEDCFIEKWECLHVLWEIARLWFHLVSGSQPRCMWQFLSGTIILSGRIRLPKNKSFCGHRIYAPSMFLSDMNREQMIECCLRLMLQIDHVCLLKLVPERSFQIHIGILGKEFWLLFSLLSSGSFWNRTEVLTRVLW